MTSVNYNPLKSMEDIKPRANFNTNGKEHSNILAEKVDRLGHLLTRPVSMILTKALRIGLPLQPGCLLSKKSKLNEVAFRAKLVFQIAILSPFGLIGGLVGGALRTLASLSKKDFVYQQPSKLQEVNSPEDRVSVATYNTLLMPDFLTTRNRQTPALDRAQDTADAIENMDSGIVCMQEAFHTEATEVIGNALQKKGFHVIRNVGHQVAGLNSGLVIASKYPLRDTQFFKHPPLQSPFDAIANKGLLITKAKVGERTLIVANTHFNGGGPSNLPGFLCRSAQTIAVHAHLDRYIKEALENGEEIDGVLLCGDTNVGPTEFDRDNDVSKAHPESEWVIAHYLEKWINEDENFKKLIPTKDLDKKESWENFRKEAIDRYRKIIDPKYYKSFNNEIDAIPKGAKMSEEERRNLALSNLLSKIGQQNMGGPFFPGLYTHDLNNEHCYRKALSGSTLNLESTKPRTQTQRVDFVTVRKNQLLGQKEFTVRGKTFKVPDIRSTVILPVEKGGVPLSDHHVVRTQVQFH